MTKNRPHTPIIALLAVPESTPLALHGLYEVFHSVGRTWEDMTGEANTETVLNPVLVAKSLDTIATPVGLPIVPQATLGAADIVIVTDVAITQSTDPHGNWPAECAWLAERYRDGAIICSVCTGSVLLAEAGLLDGETATSHWAAIGLFEKHYPNVHLAADRILTIAGKDDRIVTSGGASSWEDLALYLVARLCGGQEAVRTAKIFLFGERTEGQLPFTTTRRPHRHEDALIADAQTWLGDHYHQTNPVAAMATRTKLPPRSFNRRFRAATGYAPLEYVQTLRIEEAKQLLEASDIPIDDIPTEIGYADPTHFRRLFRRRVGTTPARYRQRFSRIARRAEKQKV